MKSISAHVKNGQIVPDEPIDLFDGDAVEVLVPDDDDDEMTAGKKPSSKPRWMRAGSSSSAGSL